MKSINTLDEKEVMKLYKCSPSFFPLMYYRLKYFKDIDFSFKNKSIKHLFFSLINFIPVNLADTGSFLFDHIEEIFKDYFKTYSFGTGELDLDKNILIEFSKTFFAFDYSTKKMIYNSRYHHLINGYKAKNLDRIFWRHDGWWNNYYGEVEDVEGKDFLLEKYKDKKIKKLDKIRLHLTLMYRLFETGELKKAKKVNRKVRRFLKLRIALYEMKKKDFPPFFTNKFLIFLFCYFLSGTFSRYEINALMFLYKTSKEKKRKKIINKLIKHNDLIGNYSKYVTKTFATKNFFIKFDMRLQHVVKLIELLTDAYCIEKKEKKRKILLKKINYLIIYFLFAYKNEYYSNEKIANLFCIQEFYFILFYFLEKVYGVDINGSRTR